MNEKEARILEAVRSLTLDSLFKGVQITHQNEKFHVQTDVSNICITTTRVGLNVLKRFHMFGRPLKVHTLVYNCAAWEWQKAHLDVNMLDLMAELDQGALNDFDTWDRLEVAMGEAGLPPKARIRYCGQGTDLVDDSRFRAPRSLNGHCIALVDLDNGGHAILDTSAQQFTVPEFKIFLPPLVVELEPGEPWVKAPDETWLCAEIEELNGGALLYKQPKDLTMMYDAEDWKDSINVPIADEIYQRAKARVDSVAV